MDKKIDSLRDLSVRYTWHPDTNMTEFLDTQFPVIEKTKGLYLYSVDGKRYFDAISSWWCVNLGHSNKKIVESIQESLSKLQHVILGGGSHLGVIELSKLLATLAPKDLNHCFYASDGSSAVEASLRMVLQYWENIGEHNRKRFVSLEGGYHGDTLGAVGVGFLDSFHEQLKGAVVESLKACSPNCCDCPYGKSFNNCNIECFESMENIVKEHHNTVAGIIVEPLVQGAGGIRIYPELYLKKLRNLCDKYGLLLIFDEIAVAFGRTGYLFASERCGVTPDILVIGKGITGGYLPMSVAIANEKVFQSYENKIFWHSHTFGGNPAAVAAAISALNIYLEEKFMSNVRDKADYLKKRWQQVIEKFPNSCGNTLGYIAMIDIDTLDGGASKANQICANLFSRDIFIRNLGSVLYIWPPLVSETSDIDFLVDAILDAI